jgi:S-(hydroxymethyl)glutathione dehydrogenase/alcohol dehydrogenase
MKAAVLTELGAPLEIIDGIKIPELKYGQVLVKIFYSGVCHSQLMEARGNRGKDAWLPHLLGHEGTGEVVSIGDGVTKVKPGDHVVLGWIKGDGIEAGGSTYESPDGRIINAGAVTTFSDFSIASENRLVILPKGSPANLGVLYGCALPTGAGIVINEISLSSGSIVVVVGLGGIGISALMASKLFNPSMLIAVDIEDSKLDLAKKIGATHTVNSSKVDPVKYVQDITNGNGADFAIEAAGSVNTISQAFDMVRKNGGQCIFASHPADGEKVCIDPFDLICGKTLKGSWGGSSKPDRDIPILGNHYVNGSLNMEVLISNTYSLDNINQALQDLEDRKIVRALIEICPKK